MEDVKLKKFDVADSPLKRTLGIMFRRTLARPLLFIFPRESVTGAAIHSFFCFVKFDAVYLDSQKRVVDVIPRVRPFVAYLAPKKAAKYLIEAPAGWAAENGVMADEIIEFPSR